jgi:fucose permease
VELRLRRSQNPVGTLVQHNFIGLLSKRRIRLELFYIFFYLGSHTNYLQSKASICETPPGEAKVIQYIASVLSAL